MSTVEPEYARDRWCWPRPPDNNSDSDDPDEVEIEVGAFGETDAEPACRICLEETGPLLESPCVCAGTQRWVHHTCLRMWRMSGGRERLLRCEVCREPYTDVLTDVVGSDYNDPDTEIIHCHMSLAWGGIIMSQAMSVVAVSVMLLMDVENDDSPPGADTWATLLTMGTILNGGVMAYVLVWSQEYRIAIVIFILVQMLMVMYDYSLFTHGLSNIASGVVLSGVMRKRVVERIADDD